jgi:tetratricopeptide (TPR) repeat protein
MRIAPTGTGNEARLAEIDRLLVDLPGSTDLHFRRACTLEDVGWPEAAAQAYAAILEREPRHLGARTNLGLMLRERGDLAGALALLEPAIEHHPFAPVAHVNLAATLVATRAFAAALERYGRALELDPSFFAAHHGIALAYEALGDRAQAEAFFARAFADRAWWRLPFTGSGTPLRVLLLVSGRGGDVIAHPFLDDRVVETTMLVPDGVRDDAPLPPHDVVFNGIGDADRCRAPLERARALLARSPVAASAINDPERVLRTGRATVATRLAHLPGVIVPRIARLPRAAIGADALAAQGWSYPLLLRAPGYHAGRYVVRVDAAAELDTALAAMPSDDCFVIAYADTRGTDGAYRKYRALFIDGRVVPVHLAVSPSWMVHYFSAAMAENAAYRREEHAFLSDMRGALGDAAVDALGAIGTRLGLDYGGVDFAIDAAGRVVVFEANATMAVAPPGPDERWAYRRPAYDAVVAAVGGLIAGRAAASARRW